MKLFLMDLHVHSVLSPCAELDMGAPDIISRCINEKIDMIAITDHNSVRNAQAVRKAADGSGIEVICGLEVQSSEDIHVLCLFPDFTHALDFEEWVWDRLPRIPNRPEKFGRQLLIDENNQILGETEFLLLQGIEATVDEIIAQTKICGGVCILAHIDRQVYSYVAVLGLIPDTLKVDAVELSGNITGEEALSWLEKAGHRTLIRSSDAHRLSEICTRSATALLIERPCFDELHLALNGQKGRKVLWPWSL